MEKYQELCILGTGTFGSVSKIKRLEDDKTLVWKALSYGKMSESERRLVVQEVNLLQHLRHPYIIKYYDRIIDKDNEVIYIVMEYASNGDLSRKCKKENTRVPEDLIWKVAAQLVQALKACHCNEGGKILHRDIKPQNILLDVNGDVKLGDFGLARVLSDDSAYALSFVGTPFYMSPEQVEGLAYDEKSDIWSLGCLLYELAALRPPFQAKTQLELAARIRAAAPPPSLVANGYSAELWRVVRRLLSPSPSSRPTVTELEQTSFISLHIRERRLKYSYLALKRREEELRARERALEDKARRLERIATENDLENQLLQLRLIEERVIDTNSNLNQ